MGKSHAESVGGKQLQLKLRAEQETPRIKWIREGNLKNEGWESRDGVMIQFRDSQERIDPLSRCLAPSMSRAS